MMNYIVSRAFGQINAMQNGEGNIRKSPTFSMTKHNVLIVVSVQFRIDFIIIKFELQLKLTHFHLFFTGLRKDLQDVEKSDQFAMCVQRL